ncbi:hypothetical protein KIW84_022378 [Lathyrus oleraceus]|uniref:Uncharacterized protein n=1 Tax=Pisum sativum TaxID=3888 RepID=A0A9D4YE92_PEA|nr:hypothetical protein KIW84_022378 [Pisum sativum]
MLPMRNGVDDCRFNVAQFCSTPYPCISTRLSSTLVWFYTAVFPQVAGCCDSAQEVRHWFVGINMMCGFCIGNNSKQGKTRFMCLQPWLTASLRRKGFEVSFVSLISSIQDSQALAEGRRSRSLLQSNDQDGQSNSGDKMSLSSISISQEGANKSHSEAHATVFVHPGSDGKQHIELNALPVSVDAS